MQRSAERRDQDRHAERGAELARGVQHARREPEVLARHRAHGAHVQRREADPHPEPDHQQPGQDADVGPGVVGGGGQEGHPQHPDRHHYQCRFGELSGRPGVGGPAHERPRHQPAQRDRHDRERRLELRVAPEVHEHEREQQQRADRARREEQHPDVRVAELAVRQQPGRDHRVGRAPLPPEEQDAEQDRPLHQAEPERQVAAERVGLDQRHREEQHRAAEQEHAAHVHLLADRAEVPGLRPPAQRQHDAEDPERDVDQEDPVPARHLDQHAAEHRPERPRTPAPRRRSARARSRAAAAGTRAWSSRTRAARGCRRRRPGSPGRRSATRPTTQTAQSAEPIVNTARPSTKNLRRPNWSASRPIDTSSTAKTML